MLKLPMDSVDEVLERLPGVYLVHYVRDPRAIVTSRVGAELMWGGKIVESMVLCEKMRHDLKLLQQLKQNYPGAVITVRYEDYIVNPNETLYRMYSHFEEVPPPIIYQGLMKLMHSKISGGPFQQTRLNATESLHQWTKLNSEQVNKAMTENCKDVLYFLGYLLD